MVALVQPLVVPTPVNLRQPVQHKLTNDLAARTHRMIGGLDLKVASDCVTVSGTSRTYYVKQLATQAIRDLFPGYRIENLIQVG